MIMNKLKTQKIVISALFAALVCIATMIIRIPSPIGGYLNMGDCIILLAGWLLSPLCAAASA
ncbi:MAG: ECF transporter S component, partial [Clostridia bacterium]|nr:ECF transporter S component [Clostridia bacterium]